MEIFLIQIQIFILHCYTKMYQIIKTAPGNTFKPHHKNSVRANDLQKT